MLVATAQANLAAVDIVSGDLDGALRQYAMAEPVLRQAGAHGVLVPVLNNRWQVHMHRGDTAAAIVDLPRRRDSRPARWVRSSSSTRC